MCTNILVNQGKNNQIHFQWIQGEDAVNLNFTVPNLVRLNVVAKVTVNLRFHRVNLKNYNSFNMNIFLSHSTGLAYDTCVLLGQSIEVIYNWDHSSANNNIHHDNHHGFHGNSITLRNCHLGYQIHGDPLNVGDKNLYFHLQNWRLAIHLFLGWVGV